MIVSSLLPPLESLQPETLKDPKWKSTPYKHAKDQSPISPREAHPEPAHPRGFVLNRQGLKIQPPAGGSAGDGRSVGTGNSLGDCVAASLFPS